MYLKYFEVIMLVSLFFGRLFDEWPLPKIRWNTSHLFFFSLWASPRQEYGNIKETTTYRYFDKFFRCRAICSQNWRGISLTHESWERSGPRRSLKSSMPMYKRRWMIGSLVWHVWWHQAIQMVLTCSSGICRIGCCISKHQGCKTAPLVGVCLVYSEPKEYWRPPPIPATCRAVSGSKEIQPADKDTTWGYFRTATYHLLQILPLDSMKSSAGSLCPYKAWPNKLILE